MKKNIDGKSAFMVEPEDLPYQEDATKIWEDSYLRNKIKLMLIMLLYVYSNDDQIMSKKELKSIKKNLKKEEDMLTEKDKFEIIDLLKDNMSLTDFLSYMEKNEYQEAIFLDALNEVENIISNSGKYLLVLDELKQKYRTYTT